MAEHKHAGRTALAFTGAALAVYLYMVTGPLAALAKWGGAPPFDMRPGGYGLAEAVAFLDAIGPQGRDFYLSRQIPFDLIYPALMALMILWLMRWLSRFGVPGWLTLWGARAGIAAALADYAENAGIVAMLSSYPDLGAGLVALASTASVVKSVLSTVAYTALLIAGGWALWRRVRR